MRFSKTKVFKRGFLMPTHVARAQYLDRFFSTLLPTEAQRVERVLGAAGTVPGPP